jgi:hypothetical protein
MSTFSPSDAALEGFRLTRERPATILAWAGVYFAGIMILAVVIALGIGPKYMDFIREGGTSRDIDQFSDVLAGSTPTLILSLLLAIFLFAIFVTGINRVVLKPASGGFSFLKIGGEELRVSAVIILMWIVMSFLTSPLIVSLGVFFMALQSLAEGAADGAFVGKILMSIAMIGVTALLPVWVGVRLSLVVPHTFQTNRIDLKGAWRVTRGSFWRLAGMALMVGVFYAMIAVLLYIIDFLGVALIRDDVSTMLAAPIRYVGLAISFVVNMITPVLLTTLLVSPFAEAYRLLAASREAEVAVQEQTAS